MLSFRRVVGKAASLQRRSGTAVPKRRFSTSNHRQSRAGSTFRSANTLFGFSLFTGTAAAFSAFYLNAQHNNNAESAVLAEEEEAAPLLDLTVLYDEKERLDFLGSPPRIMAWLKDGKHYVELRRVQTKSSRKKGPVLLRVNAETGESTPLYNTTAIRNAFAGAADISMKQVEDMVEQGEYSFSPDEKAVVISHATGLYYYHFESKQAKRLTTCQPSSKPDQIPTFSPDGQMIAFIRGHDLHVVHVSKAGKPQAKALTEGGHENLMNGILDWVYQEEIYGRGDFKGYWWSPDSSKIAMLQLDESPVPPFTVIDHMPQHLTSEITRYPKAGDPNPNAKLAVISNVNSPTDAQAHWVDLESQYDPKDLLIVNVGWTPDSKEVVFQAQNKEQTYLHLNFVTAAVSPDSPPASSKSSSSRKEATLPFRTVLKESSPAWVNVLGEPDWLDGGRSFLWQSERTGFRHLYHYSRSGEQIRAVTAGDFEVTNFLGFDEKSGWLYINATHSSPRDIDFMRVKLDGSELTRLSDKAGTHRVKMNHDFSMYLDFWSNVSTPTQTTLHQIINETSARSEARSGSNKASRVLRVLDDNQLKTADYWQNFSPVEFVQVPTRDGFQLEGALIKPRNFDPSKKYPVMCYTYSGPHHPRVMNTYNSKEFLWHQLLAQNGYVVWVCDNRTASSKGAQSTWPVHGNFGELELKDLQDGLQFVKGQEWVDSGRIGLWGWSYGGYMTLYALTHCKDFKMGIAGAPVTDWRLYDSIYTERYMRTPQTNEKGYDKSSILKSATDLHGKLLLIHGTMDDNVHVQQSIQLMDVLQRNNILFDLMMYPKSRHHISSSYVCHLRTTMFNYISNNL